MSVNLENITPRQELLIAKGLCDYQYIMNHWQDKDEDFEDIYYEFYLKSRWAVMSKSNNKKVYFSKLYDVSPGDDLIDIMIDLSKELDTKSCEFSFASKLLHTRNSALPIYDSKVREYLFKEEKVCLWWQIPNKNSGAPRGTSDLDKIKHDWKLLCEWYEKFLVSQRGKTWIEWFDNKFPNYASISDIKKVDFIIFATN